VIDEAQFHAKDWASSEFRHRDGVEELPPGSLRTTVLESCNQQARGFHWKAGGNVLRSVNIVTYTLATCLEALHLNFHVTVIYLNVLYLEMVVIPASDAIASKIYTQGSGIVERVRVCPKQGNSC
jgi:hypothetical protein